MRAPVSEKPWFLAAAAATLVGGVILISAFLRAGDDRSFLCSFSAVGVSSSSLSTEEALTFAVLHYATSKITPQQSRGEISVSLRVLRERGPRCNFLVFGLGFDSMMWHSFNLRGTTLFLEEDPKWVRDVLKDAPFLRAHAVKYPTRLDDADSLLRSWRSQPLCAPGAAPLRGNRGCKLALPDLPDEVYDREWDLIMIDAPRGWFGAAPGRMGAIYSAAVMARNRRGEGPTHVFLHDVDRKVEKAFAMEFLCRKNLVEHVGRLWHFRIFPAANGSAASGGFC